MVKQWTSKCKQLKEEHSRVLDDRGRRQQDSATALRKSENEVARLKSELEDMTNSWKEEVASLRRDRMKERKRAESEAARATELAEEAMRSTVESDAISSKLEAAERSAKHVERLTREQAETREELDRIRSEHESLSSSRAADQTKISALTLERDELAREVCPSLKTKKWVLCNLTFGARRSTKQTQSGSHCRGRWPGSRISWGRLSTAVRRRF